MAEAPNGRQDVVRAAGAVLWRPAAGGVQIALVHRPKYGDWSLPKGKQMRGEHLLLTAAREVAEETGTRPVLGRPLGTTAYTANGRPKTVSYWAAVARQEAGNGHHAPGGFVPNDEVDQLAWLDVAAARDQLSYGRDVEVVAGFAAGPAHTTPLIFLRHAAAVTRESWAGAGQREDLDRPLSGAGHTQAGSLGQILNCFPPARVISSGARRCVESVRPYAELAGTSVEAEPAFTLEPGPPAREAGWEPTPAASERIAEAASGAQPVIICGHRQNLPWLLARACQQLGAPVPEGPPLGKGAFWVLHVSAGSLAAAERHDLSG